MKQLAAMCMLLGGALWAFALAQGDTLKPIPADSLRWINPPHLPGVQGAWVTGGEGKAALYLYRVRLAAGARISPRKHPDERNSTVLAGTLHVGFGESFDEAKLVPMSAGTVYVTPANTPHYMWAKDAPAEYQQSGVGPTATVAVER